MSAICTVLAEDGIEFQQDSFVLTSLIKASRIRNNVLVTCLPIHKVLLKLILDEVTKFGAELNQPYQKTLYLAFFAMAYYGLLHIGELTHSPHVLLACNVHVGTNKDKILLLLKSSKTHPKGDRSQLIKIAATPVNQTVSNNKDNKYCPFHLIKNYIKSRPDSMQSANELFFIWSDRSPIFPCQATGMLRNMISRIGLDASIYSFHGFQAGRAGDLLKLGVSVETIKKIGRWRSNAVFAYLKD